MKASALAFAFLATLWLRPAAALDGVLVHTRLDPPTGAVVGQPVQLLVDVLFPGAMPRPPRVTLGDAPGAQIMRFETQAVTIRDRIGGQDYVGQEFAFVVFARRGGTIDVPAAEITLLDPTGDPVGSARGERQRLDVAVPPGLDASGPVLATTGASASETWAPDPASAQIRTGDALVRTIRREAAGVPALGMADVRFTAPDGVRVYVDPPEADDATNRGEVTGSRLDKATYVFERPGTYELPAVTQPWWDLGAKRARSETLAGARVTVTAAPAGVPHGSRGQASLLGLVAMAGALAALLLAAASPLRRLPAEIWQRRRAVYRASEAAARASLRRVASDGDPAATYRALSLWLDRLPPAQGRAVRADPHLADALERLDRVLFGTGPAWSAQEARDLVRAAESAWCEARRWGRAARRSALPPLNPAAAETPRIGLRTSR